MKTIHKIGCVLLTICFMYSCRKTVYRPAELVRYIGDSTSGFVLTKKIGATSFSVHYLPASYNALMEMGPGQFSLDKYQQLCKEYTGSYNFRLKIRHNSGVHPLKAESHEKNEWFMLKKYFDFDVLNDVHLVQGKDTVNCTVHHHFYNDISPDLDMTFLFNKDKLSFREPVTFIYYDRLFNNGFVLFEFDEEVINFSPQIKI